MSSSVESRPTKQSALSLAAGLFCTLLLLLFVFSLAPSWNDATSYYAHSWVLGGATVALLGLRWRNAHVDPDEAVEKGVGGVQTRAMLALAGCVLVIAIARMVWTVDVSWRLPLWAQALATVVALMITVRWLSGKRALRATLPVALLLLLCVPWPSNFEQAFVNTMTTAVVDSSVFCLRSIGTPVVSVGNALFVADQQLMVAEGCSGLRSFQGSLAGALLIAEYFQIRPLQRLLLVSVSLFAAVVLNICRVLVLAKVADGGMPITAALHDRAGNITMAVLFALVFVMAALLERFASQPVQRLPNLQASRA